MRSNKQYLQFKTSIKEWKIGLTRKENRDRYLVRCKLEQKIISGFSVAFQSAFVLPDKALCVISILFVSFFAAFI